MTDAGKELIELERCAWRALSSSGEEAVAFYQEVLADRVLMLLPGGLVIDDRARALASMGGPPWDEVELIDERVMPVGDDGAVVAYRGRATRDGTTYEALFCSTYARQDDSWRLVLHQQTPC